MKKILAILLALMLVLVNVAALAEGEGTTGGDAGETGGTGTDAGEQGTETGGTTEVNIAESQKATLPQKFTLTKAYEKEGDTAIVPADTISFTVSDSARTKSSSDFAKGAGPKVDGKDQYAVTIADVAVAQAAETATITVNLPSYDLPGVYSYEIAEVDTNKAGMTYLADTLYLNITVLTNQETGDLYLGGVAVHKASATGIKIDEFTNTYKAGSLKVSKTVTGNLGDRTQDFEFTVTFTAPTTGDVKDVVNAPITVTFPEGQDAQTTPATTVAVADWSNGTATKTFTLKHGQSVTFNNIPKGVEYTVVENQETGTIAAKYTLTKTGDTGTIGTDEKEAAFTNKWDETPDTGVALDVLPYVLMMALAVISLVVLKARKREN